MCSHLNNSWNVVVMMAGEEGGEVVLEEGEVVLEEGEE